MSQMRRMLKELKIEYRVVKNTLAKIAAEETPLAVVKEHFVGQTGIAIGYDDPMIAVKKMLEYSKNTKELEIKGGFIEGKFVDVKGLKEVSKLPPREVLYAMLARAMSAPTTKMACLLPATIQRLGYAFTALKEKKNV